MSRNLSNEPPLVIDDIQGDLLGDFIKKNESLLFFTIDDVDTFRSFIHDLQITSSREVLATRALIDAQKMAGNATLVPAPALNVAFSFWGLQKLGAVSKGNPALVQFEAGMAGSQAKLADPPAQTWSILGPGQRPDGVFVLAGASAAEVNSVVMTRLSASATPGFTVIHREDGQVRPTPVAGHEHFGFADGVSQPGIRGLLPTGAPLTPQEGAKEEQGVPGQDLLWPGEFVFGYPRQTGDGDFSAEDFTVKGSERIPPEPFMRNGAFLVFRRLRQFVPEFDKEVAQQAARVSTTDEPVTPDLLGAQLVGRWKSGAPLVNAPTKNDPSIDESHRLLVNNFEFHDPDPNGVLCPFASHVRKVYPRNDVTPFVATPAQAEVQVQTHRMLRRGIAFGPEVAPEEVANQKSDDQHQRGLLFLCFVTSIEDQFEFVQQNWVNNPDFLHAESGVDPLIGQPFGQPAEFKGAAPETKFEGNKPTLSFGRFVEMQGGEYFFTPSISAVKAL